MLCETTVAITQLYNSAPKKEREMKFRGSFDGRANLWARGHKLWPVGFLAVK